MLITWDKIFIGNTPLGWSYCLPVNLERCKSWFDEIPSYHKIVFGCFWIVAVMFLRSKPAQVEQLEKGVKNVFKKVENNMWKGGVWDYKCYHCTLKICRANPWDSFYVLDTLAWNGNVNGWNKYQSLDTSYCF